MIVTRSIIAGAIALADPLQYLTMDMRTLSPGCESGVFRGFILGTWVGSIQPWVTQIVDEPETIPDDRWLKLPVVVAPGSLAIQGPVSYVRITGTVGALDQVCVTLAGTNPGDPRIVSAP